MKITDTISVNPGKTALGHVDANASSVLRRSVIGVEESAKTIDITKFLFPTEACGMSQYRKYEVPLRTIFATILIVSGLSFLIGTTAIHGVAFAIITLSFGGFLALGLLTRPVMIGAAVFYCICGALALRAGAPDMSVFSLMFGCLIFGVIGAGKYSCDAMILRELRRLRRKSVRRKCEERMGYKAFHNINFR